MGALVAGRKAMEYVFPQPKTPAAPDYASAARETASGNLAAAQYTASANQQLARQTAADNLNLARVNTVANRANQYNPYGSLIWEKGATDYDPWTQRQTFTAEGQKLFDLQNQQDMAYAQAASKGFEATKGLFENPNIDTSGMPSLRGIDMSKVSGIRGLNADGLQNIRGLTLDGLPNTALAPGQIAQDALLSRINPSLMADDEALRSRLANQGIGLGSAAYGREMGLQGQRATDLRLQAAAQGIGIDQAARQQAFGERQALGQFDMAQRGQQFGERQAMSGFDMGLNAQQFGQQEALSNQAARQRGQMMEEAYTAQSRPLDLINSLRSGSQVKNPQFQSYAQQGGVQQGGVQQQFTGGPNLSGAAQSNYNAQLDASNARNAYNNQMMQGLFSLGGAFLGG
jgi:hypothetical protein